MPTRPRKNSIILLGRLSWVSRAISIPHHDTGGPDSIVTRHYRLYYLDVHNEYCRSICRSVLAVSDDRSVLFRRLLIVLLFSKGGKLRRLHYNVFVDVRTSYALPGVVADNLH